MAGIDATPEIQELAHHAADAQIDLCRVRHARHRLLSRALSNPFYGSGADTEMKMAVIRSLVGQRAPDISYAALGKLLTSTPEGPQKFALILSKEAKELLAIDRYERRALLRRKIAIRAFDEACRSL